LVPAPIAFGVTALSNVPSAAHRFRAPLEKNTPNGPIDERVFYVLDDPTCRFVGNAFTLEANKDQDRGMYAPISPGVSFFDRDDQLELFKLHLPYICHTSEGVNTLFLSPINRPSSL